MTSMINTNVFFDFTDFQGCGSSTACFTRCWPCPTAARCPWAFTTRPWRRRWRTTVGCGCSGGGTGVGTVGTTKTVVRQKRCQSCNEEVVREVFVIHVGGTRCVTSSTDNVMKIHARITLTVECIRTCIFLVLFDV